MSENSINPMKPRDYKIARYLKKRLGNAVELIDFKVYGSKARGDDDEFSDLDVFIEVARLDRNTRDLISEIAWEVSLEYSIVISPLVFSVDETENSHASYSQLFTEKSLVVSQICYYSLMFETSISTYPRSQG